MKVGEKFSYDSVSASDSLSFWVLTVMERVERTWLGLHYNQQLPRDKCNAAFESAAHSVALMVEIYGTAGAQGCV